VTNVRRVKYSWPVTADARPRSRRDRPAKAPLSEEVIVDAALAILRAEDLKAVTMQRVATALDTGPASLYVYIKGGRDELRQAMYDRVLSTVTLEPPSADRWREQALALLERVLAAFESHPGIAAISLANPASTRPALLVAENLLAIFLAGGITRQDAALATDTLLLLTTARAIETDVWRSQDDRHDDQPDVEQHLHDTYTSLPAAEFPHFTELAEELIGPDTAARFRFAVDTFLDGLAARAKRD